MERIPSINLNGSFQGFLQPTEQREQGGLPHPVFSQQTVNVSIPDLHGNVFQDRLRAVTEAKIVNGNHIFCVY